MKPDKYNFNNFLGENEAIIYEKTFESFGNISSENEFHIQNN